MDAVEGKAAPEKEFIQAYLKELGQKPRADLVSEPDLRKRVAGLIDKVENGVPLFAHLEISINHSSLLDFAEGLESLSFSHASELLHNIVSCLSSPDSSSQPISTFAQRVVKGDGAYIAALGKKHGVSLDMLAFFGVYLTRPIRMSARKALESEHPLDNWRFGYCPVCGLWPRMARLEPEYGRRLLWCIGCDGEWLFPRLACPFCFEKDQKKLGYLTVDGWPGYRIYTCDTCRRYLKTRDDRQHDKTQATSFDMNYLQTSTLDAAAHQEGFIKDFVGCAAFDMKDNKPARAYRAKGLSSLSS